MDKPDERLHTPFFVGVPMKEYHDPDTLKLIQQALSAAAHDAIGCKVLGVSIGTYAVMASAVTEAADKGECSFERLKALALASILNFA